MAFSALRSRIQQVIDRRFWPGVALLLTLLVAWGVCAGAWQTREMNRGAAMAYAASRNDVRALRVLVRQGYSVNDPVYKGRSPLLCAVLGQHHDALGYLLDEGADPGREMPRLLAIARSNGDAESVRLLLRARR